MILNAQFLKLIGLFFVDFRCLVLWCDSLCHVGWCVPIWRSRRS